MTHYIDLDVCGNEEEIANYAKDHNLTHEIIERNGPAGGNPIVRFTGEEGDVQRIAHTHANDELEYEETFFPLIKELSE